MEDDECLPFYLSINLRNSHQGKISIKFLLIKWVIIHIKSYIKCT